ncbi:MAG: 5-methylcytosine restriction system specificity protein McrC [Candidatus Xenobia bacterium]
MRNWACASPAHACRRVTNIAINHLVLGCLRVMKRIVGNQKLSFDLHARDQLLSTFCSYQGLSSSLLHQAQTRVDRRNGYYRPVISLAEVILLGLGQSFISDTARSLRGFLFDMNRLFETLVARLCSMYLPPGLTVKAQYRTRAAYHCPPNDQAWCAPELRPDLVIRNSDDQVVLILDTKYKLLDGKRPSNEDLYQMTLYSMAFGRRVHSRIIYPSMIPGGKEPVLHFVGCSEHASRASVGALAVSLPDLAAAIRVRDETKLKQLVRAIVDRPAHEREAVLSTPGGGKAYG